MSANHLAGMALVVATLSHGMACTQSPEAQSTVSSTNEILPTSDGDQAMSKTIYDHTLTKLDGTQLPMSSLQGSVIVVVNTASGCGYTPQFKQLQEIHEQYADQGLVVVGVPSNDFNQEDLDATEIGEFCKLNYGVTFAMTRKEHVKGPDAHPLYKTLTKNIATSPKHVSWNFEKFLIARDGTVVHHFRSADKPDSPAMIAAIEKLLGEAS